MSYGPCNIQPIVRGAPEFEFDARLTYGEAECRVTRWKRRTFLVLEIKPEFRRACQRSVCTIGAGRRRNFDAAGHKRAIGVEYNAGKNVFTIKTCIGPGDERVIIRRRDGGLVTKVRHEIPKRIRCGVIRGRSRDPLIVE